jgi:membrane-bound lytic murein transglycosylase A
MRPAAVVLPGEQQDWRLRPAEFDRIPGWREDDFVQALSCFRNSARRMIAETHRAKAVGVDPQRLRAIGQKALAIEETALGENRRARDFFEEHFRPLQILPSAGAGFVTGYYEPELLASPVRTSRFAYPLYRRPPDLVEVDAADMPQDWDRSYRFARLEGGRPVEYHDRAAIEAGALAGRGLELAWIEDAIDGFFVHIQGSARLTMPDGAVKRITFDGKSGHPFTPIGRVLIELGELRREEVTMETIRAWLKANPDRAAATMALNRSFIFFAATRVAEPSLGPFGAAGVQLTPGRSLAVDRELHTFASPIFVAVREAFAGHRLPFRRLMIAQDTGSAIVGVGRGDLFVGSGAEAGEIAGAIRHAADFFLLAPVGGAPLAGEVP